MIPNQKVKCFLVKWFYATPMQHEDEAVGRSVEKAFGRDFLCSIVSGWIAEQGYVSFTLAVWDTNSIMAGSDPWKEFARCAFNALDSGSIRAIYRHGTLVIARRPLYDDLCLSSRSILMKCSLYCVPRSPANLPTDFRKYRTVSDGRNPSQRIRLDAKTQTE
jgi:hypothetical protein